MAMVMAESVETISTSKDFHFPPSRRNPGAGLWVFSEQGLVLASNSETPPPVSWDELKKPVAVHDLVSHYAFLRLVPDLMLIRLEGPEKSYLLIESRHRSPMSGAFWIQVALLLFVVGVTFVVALGMISVYLRQKSREAHLVLSRLEKGDLKARFEIKRIDEIGSLMSDFNRMAAEIERLVNQIQLTETARKNLLEELGHDLRTPLTSLKTSVETLSDHMDEMPKEEQKEFISVIRTELTYFLHLIEDLFFIADLGEPKYKKTTAKIDLVMLLMTEVKGRETQKKIQTATHEPGIEWETNCNDIAYDQALILGDPHLIQRLFKNALDNAAKHAESKIKIHLQPSKNSISVLIEDDGPGITDEEIAVFGLRRKHRFTVMTESKQGLSLGLGSVIMKTILELHGGELKIGRRRNSKTGQRGSQLVLSLPKD